ncbi:MAG: multicopper oxidase domain-containing protein [Myxococcota bacterium]
MSRMLLLIPLASAWLACDGDAAPAEVADAATDTVPDVSAADTEEQHAELTWDQVALGCALMGSGAAEHVMCQHGHSLSLRGDPLYERWLYLRDHGLDAPTDADLMTSGPVAGSTGSLPPPLTLVLRAREGERVRLRVVSYGPQFHTFHVHGHLWLDDGTPTDTHTLGPAEVYDKAEFYAGGGADDPAERAGVGDWMMHCHVEMHMATGMWGIFRVEPKDGSEGLGDDGRFPYEIPAPLGGDGQTIDVWVAAATVPIAVGRAYFTALGELADVERDARLYVPFASEAEWQAATAASVRTALADRKEDWTPWVLSLRLGTTVRVHLKNLMSDAPVSLHPHGVRYTSGEDGTMPDDVVLPGGAPVTMTWTADTAGTWPLHDHARTLENLARGLFAAIVVKTPDDETRIARDYIVFMHDYDMDWLMGAEEPTGATH